MKKELGKWFIDISKYLITAVVFGTIFANQEEKNVYIYGCVLGFVMLLVGLIFVREKKETTTKGKFKNNKYKKL